MGEAGPSLTKEAGASTPALAPGGGGDAELLRLVFTDDLTGLYNRRFFSKYLKQDADWAEGAAPLCLCIMDLDYLKRINDRLGHLSGDRVLKQIGALLRAAAGDGNLPVRYAGDEFAVLLPGKTREEALEVAERCRVSILEDPFEEAGLPEGMHPSLSVGVARFPDDAKTGEELVDRADKALYFSKRTGKNKVTNAADVEGQSEVADLDSLAGFPSRTLVGRDDAFHAVGDAVDVVAAGGRNAFVLVEGAPGIGKTRFLSELVRYAKERDLVCLLEKCTPVGREEPYKAIAGLLDRYFRAEPKALAHIARTLDAEKRAALGEIVPSVREHETIHAAATAAAGLRATTGKVESPSRALPRGAPPPARKAAAQPQQFRPQVAPPPGAAPAARPAAPGPRPAGGSAPLPRNPADALGSGVYAKPAGLRAPAPPEGPGAPAVARPAPAPTGAPALPRNSSDVLGSGVFAKPTGLRPGPAADGLPKTAADATGAEVFGKPGTVRSTTESARGKLIPPAGAPAPAAPAPGAPRASGPPTAQGPRPTVSLRPVAPPAGPSPAPAPRRPDAPAAPAAPAALADAAARPAETRPGEPSPPRSRPVTLFTSICDSLVALSELKPVLLMFDNVESADEATLEVVARSLPRDGRILFCGAAQEGASTDEEAPFSAFSESLSEHANVFKIELTALDRERTAELVTHLLQGFRPDVRLIDRLFLVSKGNPLFIEGALRYLVTTGVIVRAADGQWKTEKETPETIPVTLEDLVRGQLAVVDKETAELLADAAVIGPNFDFEVLKNIGGKTRSEGEALDLVEAARKARLLKDTGAGGNGGDFEFASSVVADVTYKNLSAERKQTTHRKVAELVERSNATGDQKAAQLAYHYRLAGDKEKADRFEVALRERSEQIFDREAIEQLDDVKPPRIPEVIDAPSPHIWPHVAALVKAWNEAVKAQRALPQGQKLPVEARASVLAAVTKCFEVSPAFTIAHRGNSVVLNGENAHAVHGEGPLAEEYATLYRANSVKSITFLKGPSIDEVQTELDQVLAELASRTKETSLERHFWWRFGLERDLRRVCVQQKVLALKRRKPPQRRRAFVRIAEHDLPRVREFVWNFTAACDGARKHATGTPQMQELGAAIDRTLRQILAQVPALAINELDGNLVVNGTTLTVKVVGNGAGDLVKLLRETKLRGFCLLDKITPQELQRFVERAGRLGPKDVEGDRDPGREISADGSFPNVLVGEAMFKMAAAALGKGGTIQGSEEGPDPGAVEEAAAQGGDKPVGKGYDGPDESSQKNLPSGFTWPSDAVAQKARELVAMEPVVLVVQKRSELVDTCEALLLDGRDQLAKRLFEHLAFAFTSKEPVDRRRAAEVYQEMARRGSAELRARFVHATVKRLADAAELELDVDVFESLARAAKLACLDRIWDGDWDVVAKLVWALGKRREATAATNAALQRIARETLSELLRDPRAERLWDTLETGSVQDRRRAARVLEGMGTVAIGPLLDALKRTSRARVETLLIGMLSALAPESEQALVKETTPYAPGSSVIRLLHGAGVICKDPTPVLVAGLQNPDPAVRVEAVEVARSIGGAVAQTVLKWAVKHGTVEAKLAAVKGLGEVARGDTADSILEFAESAETVEVLRECCIALGKLQIERSVSTLVRLLRPGSLLRASEHEDVRHAAAWALGQMRQNDEARKALERALEDKSQRVALAAKLFLQGRA